MDDTQRKKATADRFYLRASELEGMVIMGQDSIALFANMNTFIIQGD